VSLGRKEHVTYEEDREATSGKRECACRCDLVVYRISKERKKNKT